MGAGDSILDNCYLRKANPLLKSLNYAVHFGETGDGNFITAFLQKKERKESVKKFAKNLKTIRHPHILHFIASGTSSGVQFLATEVVVPLNCKVSEMGSVELVTGLGNITDALEFLHDKVKASHNYVNLLSIYTTVEGSWKLGNFEYMCKFSLMSQDLLKRSYESQDSHYVPPEEQSEDFEMKPNLIYGHDVYALGALTQALLSSFMDDEGVPEILAYVKSEILDSSPEERPTMKYLHDLNIFRNDLMDILEFLSSISLKPPEEKEQFFKNLLPRLKLLPPELIARRLTHPLLSRFVVHENTAQEFVLPHLLIYSQISERNPNLDENRPLIPTELYCEYVVPVLKKIFLVRNLHIRLFLLHFFPFYVNAFTEEELMVNIFPEILIGLRDTNSDLVVATLQSLAHLVPILGADVVIGGQREAYFKRGCPMVTSTTFNNYNISADRTEEFRRKSSSMDGSLEEHPADLYSENPLSDLCALNINDYDVATDCGFVPPDVDDFNLYSNVTNNTIQDENNVINEVGTCEKTEIVSNKSLPKKLPSLKLSSLPKKKPAAVLVERKLVLNVKDNNPMPVDCINHVVPSNVPSMVHQEVSNTKTKDLGIILSNASTRKSTTKSSKLFAPKLGGENEINYNESAIKNKTLDFFDQMLFCDDIDTNNVKENEQIRHTFHNDAYSVQYGPKTSEHSSFSLDITPNTATVKLKSSSADIPNVSTVSVLSCDDKNDDTSDWCHDDMDWGEDF